jgi:hypothetical protein
VSWPKDFGLPPDAAAVVALCIAVLLLFVGRKAIEPLLASRRRWLIASVIAVAAAALSSGYVVYYLRGGPRIIDATSYFLEARALARGLLTWPALEPTASLRGRFLLLSGPPSAERLGVIFPPGYPALLAIGFLLRAPMWVGPILAGLLALATHELARRVSGRDDVARIAALLSLVCATLRYHTADTMSHGLSALLLTTALLMLFDAATCKSALRAAAAGLLVGWLVATRPATAVAVLPLIALLLVRLRARDRVATLVSLALPVTLFAVQQRAVTGAWLVASQTAYYAVADGPPGCFRVGLGRGIGCLHEHGAYVRALLPDGFGLFALVVNTLRRLRLHLMDIANAEPLALLVVLGAWLGRRDKKVALLTAGTVLIVLVYAPFYFDGSYPGGGARFYADVLPLEHVLGALGVAGLADLAQRKGRAWLSLERATVLTFALSLAGFGLHAAYLHRQLAEREGGRPYFEPDVLALSRVSHGLLFTGTDHAFGLAFDPGARDPTNQIVVAREQGDDRDRLFWERLGRPPTYRYVFEGRPGQTPAVVPFTFAPFSLPYRYEAEAEWPPIAQEQGFVEPMHATGTCAWGGRVLTARPQAGRSMRALISFPAPAPGRFYVAVHIASKGKVAARIALLGARDGPPIGTWRFSSSQADFRCTSFAPVLAELSARGYVEILTSGDELSLDAIALEPAPR